MGERTFGELFVESKGAPIQFEGREVAAIHRMAVCATEFYVRFRSANARVRQALRLKLDRGTLTVNGQELTDVVLWADTAPKRIVVRARPREAEGELKLWNAWEDERGTMQAWIGNGGMHVEPLALLPDDAAGHSHSGVVLACSDGEGAPDFADLVVEVEIECPVEIARLEAFLRKAGAKETRREKFADFGDRLFEYRLDGLAVRAVRDRGVWEVDVCDEVGQPGEWYDAALLARWRDPKSDDSLPLRALVAQVTEGRAFLAEAFGSAAREKTHLALARVRAERVRRLFPGWFPPLA